MTESRTMRVRRDELVSRQEAAEILHLHPNIIDRMGREKILTRYKIAGVRRVFYLKAQVESCIVEMDPDETFDEEEG